MSDQAEHDASLWMEEDQAHEEEARRARWTTAFHQALATYSLGGAYVDACVIPLMELSDQEFVERTAAMREGNS